MKPTINKANVEALLSNTSSNAVFKQALKSILPTKKSWKHHIIIGLLAILPTSIIGFSVNTITFYVKSVETINGIILALFGITFTGYAFFQALINDDLLIRLFQSPNKSSLHNRRSNSFLQDNNEFFANLMMLDTILVLANCFLIIVFGSIPPTFILFKNYYLDCITASILIWLYFFYAFLVMWEMKSFIYNTFQLFNTYASSRAVNIIQQQSKEDTSSYL